MAHTPNLLYQRYRLMALVVYVAVFLAGLTDYFSGGLGPKTIIIAPELTRFIVFLVSVYGLIGLELQSIGQKSFEHPTIREILPFLARLGLFVSACLVTDMHYTQVLFLPILLYTYLAIGKRWSYCLAVLGVVTLFSLTAARVGTIGPPIHTAPNGVVKSFSPFGGLLDRSTGALISLLFTLLLAHAMSQATTAQHKLSELLHSLESSHAQLQSYATQVADLAATEERNRLARNIHDSLGHHLAAINIQLRKAEAYRDRDLDRAYEAIHYAQNTVQVALKDVRASVSSLRQSNNAFCFETELQDLMRRMKHSGLQLNLDQSGDIDPYNKLQLMTLYRVIQEGLTNVHKHSRAQQVNIVLDFTPHAAHLTLTDDGVGFDVAAWQTHRATKPTHGLIGLQERLTLLGGSIDITSQPRATSLRILLPQSHPTTRLNPISRP